MGIKSKFSNLYNCWSHLGGIKGIYKTIVFNLRNFPLKTALRMPVWISGKARISGYRKGNIVINGRPNVGMLRIGAHSHEFCAYTPTLAFIGGTLSLTGGNVVVIESGCFIGIGKGCSLLMKGSLYMNSGSRLVCHNHIEIGHNNVWQENSIVMDHDTYEIRNNGNRVNYPRTITIGDNVWLQPMAAILEGSIIPDNSIVKTGSIVTSDCCLPTRLNKDESPVFQGNPAKMSAIKGTSTRIVNLT